MIAALVIPPLLHPYRAHLLEKALATFNSKLQSIEEA
jgi:hypothetical protein